MPRALAILAAVLTVAAATRAPRAEAPGFDLPFFYDLYTFRGDGETTTVIGAFAVPVDHLGRRWVDHGVRYRFDLTLVLSDTALGTVSRADDSVYVRVPRPLDGDHLLHTHLELQAPPSTATLQRVVMTDAETPGIGQLYTSPFPIPDYSGTLLMLSDIALGLPDAPRGWRRGDVTLALLPTSQFPQSSFDVYYEIYNLPAGNRYTTEVAIEPVDPETGRPDEDASPVRTRYFGESRAGPDGSLPELRRVESSLEKGRYRLTVTVTDERTGQTARRARLFEVRGWSRGATMVPALRKRTTGEEGA